VNILGEKRQFFELTTKKKRSSEGLHGKIFRKIGNVFDQHRYIKVRGRLLYDSNFRLEFMGMCLS